MLQQFPVRGFRYLISVLYTVSARKIKTLQISEMVLSKPQIWYLPSWDVVFDITKAIFKYRSIGGFF